MPHEGGTRAGILSGRPSLDRGSRVAEVGFEPRTFRSVNSRSNHLGHLAPPSTSKHDNVSCHPAHSGIEGGLHGLINLHIEQVYKEGGVDCSRILVVEKGANLLTGRSVGRTRPLPLDFHCLGLDNLAVSQPSCFLLMAWQLDPGRVL
ncbi:hypothetical protein T265_12775, partial [Opisthorchis viverrini]